MKIISVDLEMNQPSGALIQIGAVRMDLTTGVIEEEFMVHVNPCEQLSEEIKELTAITQEQVDAGLEVAEAVNWFWAFAGKKTVCSWGRDAEELYDFGQTLAGVKVPHRLTKIDLKQVSSLLRCAYPSNKRRGGLQSAVGLFGLQFQGRPHDALVDARNTALLATHLVRRWRQLLDVLEVLR